MCAHHGHLLAWLLASSLMAVSPPCHPTAHLHHRAGRPPVHWKQGDGTPMGAEAHERLPGCHLGRGASAGRRNGHSAGCKPSMVLGVQGLHKRLYNTPLPRVQAQLKLWLQKNCKSLANIQYGHLFGIKLCSKTKCNCKYYV